MVAAGMLFVHVYIAYIGHHNQPEFLESYNSQKKGKGAEEKFVYFFLPNLSSYSYMAMDKSPTAFKTRKIINGFYQKNKFIVYPKAFAPEESFLQNMVRALNPESKEASIEKLSKLVMEALFEEVIAGNITEAQIDELLKEGVEKE